MAWLFFTVSLVMLCMAGYAANEARQKSSAGSYRNWMEACAVWCCFCAVLLLGLVIWMIALFGWI